MKISLSNAIYFLLILLPLSFKIKLTEEILVYPQEILLPILLIFYFTTNIKAGILAKAYIFNYFHLFAALLLILICTLISFFNVIAIGGLLKTLKYLLYSFIILVLVKSDFTHFTRQFYKIGIITVICTLLTYSYNFIVSGNTIQEFYYRSMWEIEIMPTGFSNLNLNLNNFSFERATGNHGVYGAYLVLLYIFGIGINKLQENKFTFRKTLSILLIIINLLLLTSRETLLLFVIVNLYLFKGVFNITKIKKRELIIVSSVLIAALCYFTFSDTELVIFSKIKYTIESFAKGGEESNISLRFNVWKLTLLSFLIFPFHLLVGYGYNTLNYTYYLIKTNNFFHLHLKFPDVPESFFFFFLAYGGILAFFLALLFFINLIIRTYKLRKTSTFAGMFFCFTFMLFITNNTGGSMLSDLLFSQYALAYIFLNKINEQD